MGLAPCRVTRSEISPGAMVILIGGQVWNPLLGSLAGTGSSAIGQILPSTLNFSISQVRRILLKFLYLLHSHQTGNASSLIPLPFPFRNKPTALGSSLPSDPAAGHSALLLGGKVWEVELSGTSILLRSGGGKGASSSIHPGTEPMTRCASRDTCTHSPMCPGRRWGAPFPVCPYQGPI